MGVAALDLLCWFQGFSTRIGRWRQPEPLPAFNPGHIRLDIDIDPTMSPHPPTQDLCGLDGFIISQTYFQCQTKSDHTLVYPKRPRSPVPKFKRKLDIMLAFTTRRFTHR